MKQDEDRIKKSYDNTVWTCRLFLPCIQTTPSDHQVRVKDRLSGAALRHMHGYLFSLCLNAFGDPKVTQDNQTRQTESEQTLNQL